MTYNSILISSTKASPAELIVGRNIRTVLSSYSNGLNLKWPHLKLVREADSSVKSQMKKKILQRTY